MPEVKTPEELEAAVKAAAEEFTAPIEPKPIVQIYLCTLTDRDGVERVLSQMTRHGMVPMMTVDDPQLQALKDAAQRVADQMHVKLRILKLSSPEVLEVIEERLVKPM